LSIRIKVVVEAVVVAKDVVVVVVECDVCLLLFDEGRNIDQKRVAVLFRREKSKVWVRNERSVDIARVRGNREVAATSM
jgi:hypothetical protein